MSKEQRLAEIVAMKNDGRTLQEIADAHELTRQRISQLLKAANYHCHPVPCQPRRTPEQQERRKQYAREKARQWAKDNRERRNATQRRNRAERRAREAVS